MKTESGRKHQDPNNIIPGPGDNEFSGLAKVSTLDLQDKEVGASEVRLEGKRIQVEP